MFDTMRQWYRSETPASHSAAPQDVDQVTALRLVLTDTYEWKCPWAGWRIAFAYDDVADSTFHRVSGFVRVTATSLCRGEHEAVMTALYLKDEADLRAVTRAFGTVRHGPGRIAAVQNRLIYDHGMAVAALLADAARDGREHGPPLADMPDISWNIRGFGTARVATAEIRGHHVVVRIGSAPGEPQFWLVDVDQHRACARFHSRSDAMSKYGIALALKARRSRGVGAGE